MSMCKICLKGQDQHNKKLWSLHQTQICAFCSKGSSEHSWKLWQIHNITVERGRQGSKLYPITVGFARTCIARLVKWTTWNSENSIGASNFQPPVPPYDKEFIPIYMECTECNLYLGSTEEDFADVLDGMCLKCFRELIGQTDVWYDKPPATKILKEGVKIRMYRDSKGKWHKLYGNFTNAHHCGEDSH